MLKKKRVLKEFRTDFLKRHVVRISKQLFVFPPTHTCPPSTPAGQKQGGASVSNHDSLWLHSNTVVCWTDPADVTDSMMGPISCPGEATLSTLQIIQSGQVQSSPGLLYQRMQVLLSKWDGDSRRAPEAFLQPTALFTIKIEFENKMIRLAKKLHHSHAVFWMFWPD